MGTRMSPLNWQLLVMVETIRKEGMISGHRYLHGLNDTLKLFDALKDFLHSGQVTAVCLCLPNLLSSILKLSLQSAELRREILFPITHSGLVQFVEPGKALIQCF